MSLYQERHMAFPDREYYYEMLHVFARFTRAIHDVVASKKVRKSEVLFNIEMTLFEMEEELKACWTKYLEENFFPENPMKKSEFFFECKLNNVRVQYSFN